MLECLEFREEKNNEPDSSSRIFDERMSSLLYGKFSFSGLEKGQGLTLSNTLRRILLYEIPAVGITSVFLRSKDISNTKVPASTKGRSGPGPSEYPLGDESFEREPDQQSQENILSEEEESCSEAESERLDPISKYHEFSSLPAVKESVLEILYKLKGIIFENTFPYSVPQKATLTFCSLDLMGTGYTPGRESGSSSFAGSWAEAEEPQPREAQSCTEGVPFGPGSGSELTLEDYKIRAAQIVLPKELRIVNPEHILATLMNPETPFELEITIEKIAQSNLNSLSSISGRALNRSTRNRRILPIDGTVFPVKKVNYTIENDSFDKEIVFFEVWTNGGIHPREAVFEALEKAKNLFQKFI